MSQEKIYASDSSTKHETSLPSALRSWEECIEQYPKNANAAVWRRTRILDMNTFCTNKSPLPARRITSTELPVLTFPKNIYSSGHCLQNVYSSARKNIPVLNALKLIVHWVLDDFHTNHNSLPWNFWNYFCFLLIRIARFPLNDLECSLDHFSLHGNSFYLQLEKLIPFSVKSWLMVSTNK